ncbi:caspase, EACC1-associated type [Dactylosporangium sp. CS-047395]|uniref:caspase, EACC1-associated type n=1 Tax=Dactylosporangium sp. CS-047395 TaxID=3239936 RepID=UPI003D937785
MHKALLICNADYTEDPGGLPNLRGPRCDGQLLRDALIDDKTGIFAPENVTLLLNQPYLQMLRAINVFFRQATPDDELLFYFSGHGCVEHSQLYLCASDSNSGLLPSSSVGSDSIKAILLGSVATAKVFLLDCCHGGAFGKGAPAIAEHLSGRGLFTLASAPSSESAKDAPRDGQPSPFTRALVEGLTSGAAADESGNVNLESLYNYVRRTLAGSPEPSWIIEGVGSPLIARRPVESPAETVVPPPAAETGQEPPPPAAMVPAVHSPDFLSSMTDATSVSALRVANFRRELREDIARRMPEQLSAVEFLQRAHLMQAGRLTVAGALLFGEDPVAVLATAMVQCSRFHGGTIKKLDLFGSIPEQIQEARQFVEDLARRGEMPTEHDALSQPVYDYPMIAVREIVANALVHRDYEHRTACVHVQMREDRLRVMSPGTWAGGPLPEGETVPLASLQTESHKRNFRLASILTWMRVVEGEGSGIPRSLLDCQRIGAPIPQVTQSHGMLIVEIFPRADRGGDGSEQSGAPPRDVQTLASGLAQMPELLDGSTRQHLVNQLPAAAQSAISRHPIARTDIERIVTATCALPGGPRLLYSALLNTIGAEAAGNARAAFGSLLGPPAIAAASFRVTPGGGPKAYISATQKDLLDCRGVVHAALRRLGIADVAMEAYVADGRPPLERCLADVAASDIYIGLFAWRYGFRPAGHDMSITELEYREAVRLRKACYIFLLSEDASWPMSMVDRDEDGERIAALREELRTSHVCSFFTGPDDLAAQVTAALANYHGQEYREPAGEADEPLAEEQVDAYLHRLRQQYVGIELDALNPRPTIDYLSVRLQSIFVEPSVREEAAPEVPRAWWQRLPAEDDPELPDDRRQAVLLRESYELKAREHLFDVVADPGHPFVVILGDPGSGKSAVTRFLALTLADGAVPARLAGLRDHLPVLIELRSFLAHLGDGRCEGFLDYLGHRADTDRLGLPREGLTRYLRGGGKALFLFDGLDEILNPHRRDTTASQIAAFAFQFPGVRVLVTSRTVGYPRRTLTEAGFHHFTLDNFDGDQIEQFLTGWHAHSMPAQEVESAVLRARIHDVIAESAAIRELAGNPLLLTIFAVMSRSQELPKERWRLFDHAAEVLIVHWDVNRQLREHHGTELDENATKTLLQRLALWMQSNAGGLSGNYIAKHQLVRVFEDYLVERFSYSRGAASAMANTMIEQLRERNFMLGRYGSRLYGFVHRAFLEFFSAQAIVERFEESDPEWSMERLRELFEAHWADADWREVLRLIVGQLPDGPAGELIEMLAVEVNRPWPAEEFAQPPWNLVLAAQCLAEVPDVRSVAAAAQTVLRQLILFIEHGIAIGDRTTAEIVEAAILPTVRVLGEHWPGRQAFGFWYRRRGIAVSWVSGSYFATRIAALLAAPQEAIEDVLDDGLGEVADRRARHALVAGLAEVAARPGLGDRPAGIAHRARCEALLANRARSDQHGAVRLAAAEALVANFDSDSQTTQLLVELASDDPYPDLRLMAVQTLGRRPELDDALGTLLVERATRDPDEAVRRSAVQALGRHVAGRPDIEQLLMDCIRTDLDPGAVAAATRALVGESPIGDEVRGLLMARADTESSDPVRRCALRLLAEWCPDEDVLGLLVATLRAKDADPRTRAVSIEELVRLDKTGRALRELLADLAAHDGDGWLRLVALRTLTERYQPDRSLLVHAATVDTDADVRMFALEQLAKRWPDHTTVDLLAARVREHGATSTRVAAIRLLAEQFTGDPVSHGLIMRQAAEEADPAVRLAATRALLRHSGSADVRDLLLDRVHSDDEPKIVRESAEALAGWPDHRKRARDRLAERSRHDEHSRVRLAALHTLVGFDRSKPVDLLLDLVAHDPDPQVFRAAAEILGPHPGFLNTLAGLLMSRAAEPDPAIRRPACELLGRLFGDDERARAVLADHAEHDDDIQVRRVAVAALGATAGRHPQVRPLLVAMLDDTDWSVRRNAVHALGRQLGDDETTRALFSERARTSPDEHTRRLFGEALTWLPRADPEDLPSVV